MGKRLPEKICRRIAALRKSGRTQKEVAEMLGVSIWSVKRVTIPGFIERERERWRRIDEVRGNVRAASYEEWRKAYFDSDAYRARAKEVMRQMRQRRQNRDEATS